MPAARGAGHPRWLFPDWKVKGVGALMTTRDGGTSAARFESMNLGAGVGDDPQSVLRNRAILSGAINSTPVYLQQVHATSVVRLDASDALGGAPLRSADGSVTTAAGVACAVLVADCLPVLFAAPDGKAVGAAHAGWRGLSLGVVEATLRAVSEASGCAPAEIQAWLGACIGPGEFEVGQDVLEAFGVTARVGGTHFVPKSPGKWYGDLAALARDRLHACGVTQVSGGHWCTVADASRFFSYRRDRVTGRMVAAVWIERGGDA